MDYKRLYEDDNLENDIKHIVLKKDDYSDEVSKYNSFEYHYFLSHLRHNLFLWYPFNNEGSLLEIGSSYGQLTSLFTQKVNHVVAVENTQSKCDLISKRAKDAEVILSDFNNIDVDNKFDYIVLCNIFEYANEFYDSKNPYEDYLNYLKTLLKEDGVILLALSNRLGLKYFAGFREEHTNQFFSGVGGYVDNDDVKTFSRTELIKLIEASEFTNYKFFYPFPNHEFPDVINTDKYINKIPYSRQTDYSPERSIFFDEGKLNQTLSHDNLSQYFSNSFLVEIRNSDNDYETDKIDYVKINSDRKEEFRTVTIMRSDNIVSKSPLSLEANNHINNIFEKTKSSFGKIKFLEQDIEEGSLYYKLPNQESFKDLIFDAIAEGDKDKFFNLLEDFYEALFHNSIESKSFSNNDFVKVFRHKTDKTFHCHAESTVDLMFNNLFIIDGEFVISDCDWIFDFKIPLEYIFYRVINHFYETNDLVDGFVSKQTVFNHFDWDTGNMNLFKVWDRYFERYRFGNRPFPESNILPIDNLDYTDKFEDYMHLSYLDDIEPEKIDDLRKDLIVRQRKIINSKNEEIVELKRKFVWRTNQFFKRTEQFNKRTEQFNRRTEQFLRRSEQFDIRTEQVERRDAIIARKDKEIEELVNSTSWKVTRPLRRLMSLFK